MHRAHWLCRGLVNKKKYKVRVIAPIDWSGGGSRSIDRVVREIENLGTCGTKFISISYLKRIHRACSPPGRCY